MQSAKQLRMDSLREGIDLAPKDGVSACLVAPNVFCVHCLAVDGKDTRNVLTTVKSGRYSCDCDGDHCVGLSYCAHVVYVLRALLQFGPTKAPRGIYAAGKWNRSAIKAHLSPMRRGVRPCSREFGNRVVI